jgi:hypothetical protein
MNSRDDGFRKCRARGFVNEVRLACCVVVLAVPAGACSCWAGGGTTRDAAVERMNSTRPGTLIFEGTVENQELNTGPIRPPAGALSMTSQGQHRLVTIQASLVYRGSKQDKFVVATGAGGGDCGVDFETGEKYLVFANETAPGIFFTSVCAGTGLLSRSMAAVRLLRGEPPAAEDLLDARTVMERWTGTVCGKVVRPDGQPLSHAMVFLSKARKDGFPPLTVTDPDLSRSDGSFCIQTIFPGNYLLRAEYTDFDASARWAGFFPNGFRREEAAPVNVVAGKTTSDLKLTVERESLFNIDIQVVAADRSPLPLKGVRIEIWNLGHDPHDYHSRALVGGDGSTGFRYIPAGRYVVTSYFDPVFETGPPQMPPEGAKWKSDRQEVEIAGNTKVVLTLTPIK